MTALRSEVHYLNCQDPNCDFAPCVDRRENEQKLVRIQAGLDLAYSALKLALPLLKAYNERPWTDAVRLAELALRKSKPDVEADEKGEE